MKRTGCGPITDSWTKVICDAEEERLGLKPKNYCKFGQSYSDSRGVYMLCPKDCSCTSRQLKQDEPRDYSPILAMIVGFGICSLIYVIYSIIDALTKFNNLMSH